MIKKECATTDFIASAFHDENILLRPRFTWEEPFIETDTETNTVTFSFPNLFWDLNLEKNKPIKKILVDLNYFNETIDESDKGDLSYGDYFGTLCSPAIQIFLRSCAMDSDSSRINDPLHFSCGSLIFSIFEFFTTGSDLLSPNPFLLEVIGNTSVHSVEAAKQFILASANTQKLLDIIQEKQKSKPPIFKKIDNHYLQWEGHSFRHHTEIELAKELDKYNLTFFPSAAVRINNPLSNKKQTLEADFLVFYNGKWGILELDGSSHKEKHYDDAKRARLFRQNGFTIVEHYPSTMSPHMIVSDFLKVMEAS